MSRRVTAKYIEERYTDCKLHVIKIRKGLWFERWNLFVDEVGNPTKNYRPNWDRIAVTKEINVADSIMKRLQQWVYAQNGLMKVKAQAELMIGNMGTPKNTSPKSESCAS